MKYFTVQVSESDGVDISSSPSLIQLYCIINSFVGLVLQTIRVTSLKTRTLNLDASIFGKECTSLKFSTGCFTRRVLSFNDSDRRPTIKGEGGDNNIEIKQLLIGVGSISFHPRGKKEMVVLPALQTDSSFSHARDKNRYLRIKPNRNRSLPIATLISS
ncbi:hypothetical protein CEXT_506971 [Caerostris extrusa]|uniref:Uncharacterized protein n=1 Tax=Caerostris extrusa TaxID=172846 RepID=A0AAV4NNG6_CAEEX|nr:hypothetical protein CEXT_506971 [Caerostris extrusa]